MGLYLQNSSCWSMHHTFLEHNNVYRIRVLRSVRRMIEKDEVNKGSEQSHLAPRGLALSKAGRGRSGIKTWAWTSTTNQKDGFLEQIPKIPKLRSHVLSFTSEAAIRQAVLVHIGRHFHFAHLLTGRPLWQGGEILSHPRPLPYGQIKLD